MKSLFQRNKLSAFEQPLLNDATLQALRTSAEQLDTRVTPVHDLMSRQAGWLPTNALGSGMDYAESRMYQTGDDPRYINWRLSARTQETYVKTFHTESRPSLCILFDRRRPMLFGTRRYLKVSQALRAATMLAHAAELHHISLQTLILDEQLLWLDQQDASAFIAEANKPCHPDNQKHSASLAFAFRDIRQHVPKGSLVYLISDFTDIADSQQAELAQLRANYTVQAIHIVDPAELDLSSLGKVSLQSMQTKQRYSLNTQKKKEREHYSKVSRDHIKQIKAHILDQGITYTQLQTDEEDIHQYIPLPLGLG